MIEGGSGRALAPQFVFVFASVFLSQNYSEIAEKRMEKLDLRGVNAAPPIGPNTYS